MSTRALAQARAFVAALVLALMLGAPAALAAPVLRVGPPDYATRAVPLAVAGDSSVTNVTFELRRAGKPARTFSATGTSAGVFNFEVTLSSDTTVTVRAFAGATEVWSETRRLKRASFAPGHPTISLRHDQLVTASHALAGLCDSKTTNVTVQSTRGTGWSTVWSGPVVPDADGKFAIRGVKVPRGHVWVRVVASNGFGSARSHGRSVYSLGHVSSYARLVLVDRSDRRLWVIRDGVVKFACRCAVGMPWTPTPTGTFKLGKRHRTPNAYWGPWRLRLWKRVKVHGVVKSVGTMYYIHGTSVPSSIGHYASHGCVRLLNKNIRKLSTVIDGYTAIIRD